jgi:hypothetical protein
MKRLITISCILILILASSFLGLHKIKQTNTDMNVLLEQIISDIDQNNYEDALQTAQTAQTLWEKSENIINTYVNHEMLDGISESMVELITHLKLKNNMQIYLIIDTIQFQLNRIYDCELPLPKNIF